MISSRQLVHWAIILAVSAAAGVLFATVISPQAHHMRGAVFGLFIGVPMLGFASGLCLPGLQSRLARLPFPLYAPIALATYVAIIVAASVTAGGFLWAIGDIPGSFLGAIKVDLSDIIYALCVLALVTFVMRVKDLIGSEVFFNLLKGRYHKPVTEERVFLFIDVVGSTQFAERHGDLRTQEYLGRFFATLAEPVRRLGGAIDDYVGDLAIVTWPLTRGVSDARCVRCVFALLDHMTRNAAQWHAEFGTVPHFRAALHGGQVVAGEIGVDRHKISYFGDTVNMTSRIEGLCRELDAPILISAELLSRIPALPQEVVATHLGAHTVRGRDLPIAVAALTTMNETERAAARIAA